MWVSAMNPGPAGASAANSSNDSVAVVIAIRVVVDMEITACLNQNELSLIL